MNEGFYTETKSEAELLMLELERRASVLQSDQNPEPQVSLLTFNLSEEWFAVRLEYVKFVTKISALPPSPVQAAIFWELSTIRVLFIQCWIFMKC